LWLLVHPDLQDSQRVRLVMDAISRMSLRKARRFAAEAPLSWLARLGVAPFLYRQVTQRGRF